MSRLSMRSVVVTTIAAALTLASITGTAGYLIGRYQGLPIVIPVEFRAGHPYQFVPKTPLIVFMPAGKRGRFPAGTPVLQAARALGVDIDSVCGGRGICGRCQVNLAEGEFAKHGIVSRADHLSAFSEVERSYGKRKTLAQGRRLSCSTRILGDVVIDVPADSQVHRQVVRKAVEAVTIELDPAIRLQITFGPGTMPLRVE